METSPSSVFRCPACGTAHPWRMEIAGGHARCVCGNAVFVPLIDPSLPREAEEDPYELAPDPAPPRSIRQRAVHQRQVEATADADAPVGNVLAYAHAVPLRAGERPADNMLGDLRTDFYLPIALIALGTLLSVIEARLHFGQWSLVECAAYVTINGGVNLVLVFIAMMAAVKLLDLGLGPLAPAMLKIAAVAILPAAIGGILREGFASAGFFGFRIAWYATALLYWAMLWFLFDLDTQETWIVTILMWAIRTWVGFFVSMAILNGIFGGGAGGRATAMPPGGGIGGSPPYVIPGSGGGGGTSTTNPAPSDPGPEGE